MQSDIYSKRAGWYAFGVYAFVSLIAAIIL